VEDLLIWIKFSCERNPATFRREPFLPSTKQYSPLSFEPDGRPSFGVEANPIDVRDASEIERAVRAFARSPNGCLIVTASPLAVVHHELIVTLAARHRLPAVYFDRMFVNAGGLISYGPGTTDPCRQAAGYVDRILKGENPANQTPTSGRTPWPGRHTRPGERTHAQFDFCFLAAPRSRRSILCMMALAIKRA
jgi:putative ABC transport system substrate-binding protein